MWGYSYIEGLFEAAIAVDHINDRASVVSCVVAGAGKGCAGVVVGLESLFHDGTVGKGSASSYGEAKDDDRRQGQDLDQGKDVVDGKAAAAPESMYETSGSQSGHGYTPNSCVTVRPSSGLHDVLTHGDGISGKIAEDDEDDTIQASCQEPRRLVNVLQLATVSYMIRELIHNDLGPHVILFSSAARYVFERTFAVSEAVGAFVGRLELGDGQSKFEPDQEAG